MVDVILCIAGDEEIPSACVAGSADVDVEGVTVDNVDASATGQ